MRILRVVLVIALTAIVAVPAQAQDAAFHGYFVDEMLPEALLEPPAINRVVRTLAKAQRVTPFCLGLERLGEIEEPKPFDARAVAVFAASYAATAQTISFKVEVPTGRGDDVKRVSLPADIVKAILTEQAHMWAYHIRVSSVTDSGDRKLTDEIVRRELNTAFLRLVNSSFTTAERTLGVAYRKYCTSQGGARR